MHWKAAVVFVWGRFVYSLSAGINLFYGVWDFACRSNQDVNQLRLWDGSCTLGNG